MESDGEKVVSEVIDIMDQHGISISDLIKLTGKRNSVLLQLNDMSYEKFMRVYKKIEDGDYQQTDKGKLLEELMYSVFAEGYSTIWNCRNNCRTSTNEIDIQLDWTENARMAQLNTAFPCFGESFLCECKNYGGAVNVTYVGKFFSLLKVTGSSMGILISWEGVTGKGPWSASKGLIKKIALKEDIYIIAIDKEDLREIYDRKNNIFSLIYDKYIALKNEIDYSTYIKRHENEEKFEQESTETA